MNMIKPKFVFTDEARAPRVMEAVHGLDFVEEVFVIGQAEGCSSVEDLFQDDGTACPENLDGVNLEDDAWIQYSSGTTGVAKPVIHAQRTPVAIIENFKSNAFGGLKFMFVNLIMNSSGMYFTIYGSVGHGELLTFSDQQDEDLIPALEKYKPAAFSIFPSQVAWLCRNPTLSQHDVSSVRVITTGGSSVNPIFEREIYDKFPGLLLLNCGYAMSETNLICSNTPPLSEMAKMDKKAAIARHVIGSVGKLLPYCRMKIVDDKTGEKLGPRGIGEICVKTPYLLKEYRNMPEENANLIRNGWAHTGDKGYYDENENIFIIGRYKECIKYNIYHVVPSYIEKHVITHPAVEDVGVVGLPHDIEGELPMAFVVPRKGQTVTAEELIKYTNERVAEEEKLRGGIRFIDKIPRNDLGKIVRPRLSKLLLENELSNTAAGSL
jgi:acyl-CoA synthetase (AMP-forming)/AMP-acid ligase II